MNPRCFMLRKRKQRIAGEFSSDVVITCDPLIIANRTWPKAGICNITKVPGLLEGPRIRGGAGRGTLFFCTNISANH